ncbi:MAG: peptidoglycan-binding domain-containing protein [Alphaproteobacteria bacterium]|nr:peptidoglycan-binding domain-containing protein [Alphaproteobacteria bacterium]
MIKPGSLLLAAAICFAAAALSPDRAVAQQALRPGPGIFQPGPFIGVPAPGLVVQGTNVVPGVGVVPQQVVREAQFILATLGLAPGPTDGIINQQTVQAIASFQAQTGLPPDGRLTPHLMTMLRQVQGGPGLLAPRHGLPPQPEVVEIQTILDFLGLNPGFIDGVYGPDTARAVVLYQREVGVPVDGRLSNELLAMLRETARMVQQAGPGPIPRGIGPFGERLGPPVLGNPFAGQFGPGQFAVPQTLPGGPAFTAPPPSVPLATAPALPPVEELQAEAPATLEGGIVTPPPPSRRAGPQPLVDAGGGIEPPVAALPPPEPPSEPIPLGTLADNLVADANRSRGITEEDEVASVSPPILAPSASRRDPVTLEDLVTGNASIENAIVSDGASSSSSSGSPGVTIIDPSEIVESAYSVGLVLEAFRDTGIGQPEFLGKIFDTTPLPFGYDAFLEDREISEYRDAGRIVLKWTGAIDVLRTGDHRFSVEMVLTGSSSCEAELAVDGLAAVRVAASRGGTTRNEALTALSQGPVPFNLTFSCDNSVPNNQAYVDLKILDPNEVEEATLSLDRLFSKNPFVQ